MKAWRSGQCLAEILSSVLMTRNKITNCTLKISWRFLKEVFFERFFEIIWISKADILFNVTLDTFDGGFLWMVSGRVECLTHSYSRTNKPVTNLSRAHWCHAPHVSHHVTWPALRHTISRIWNGNWQMKIKLHFYCYAPSFLSEWQRYKISTGVSIFNFLFLQYTTPTLCFNMSYRTFAIICIDWTMAGLLWICVAHTPSNKRPVGVTGRVWCQLS